MSALGQKQTYAVQKPMSAKGQKRTSFEKRIGSSPKRLRLDELCITVKRVRQRLVLACFLSPGQQPGRKSAFRRSSIGNQALIHRNVIQIAQPILQSFKRRHKFLLLSHGFLVLKQSTEKLGRVAQFFHLNAQFVTFVGIELRKLFSPLAYFAPSPSQLLCRENLDRNLAASSYQIVSRVYPVAALKPDCSFKGQGAKSSRCDCVLCPC